MSDAERQSLLESGSYDSTLAGVKRRVSRARERFARVLDSHAFHRLVITLIIVDTCCVLADLAYTLLTPGCVPPGPGGPVWLKVMSKLSLGITIFFVFEITLTFWAFGFQYFNPFGNTTHAFLHDLDACTVIVTFVLEIVLKGTQRELSGLLIILRLWRLIKLVEGVTVGAGEVAEDDAEQSRDIRKRAEFLESQIQTLQIENQELRARLSNADRSEPQPPY